MVYAAAVASVAVAAILHLGDPEVRRLVLNVAFLIGSAAAFGSTAVRCRVAQRAGRADRRLVWLLGATAGWLFGNGWWFYYQHLAASQPYPSFSDVGYLVALTCMAGLIRNYLPAGTDRAALRRVVVDGLLISLSIFLLGWLLYAEGALETASTLSFLALAVSVAYPVIDVMLLALIAVAMRHGLARDPSLRVLGAALGSYVLADFGWNIAAVHGGYTPGSAPFDAAWLAAYGLFAVFPWVAPPLHRADASLSSTRFSWSIGPVLLATVAAILLAFFDHDGLDTGDTALLASTGLLILLRQALLTRDFLTLTHNLESQVAQRTAALHTSHEQMRHLASHDPLTGLANRRQLTKALNEAVKRPAGVGPGDALVLLDLDDFKNVNDGLGHPVGDELLIAIARRLRAASRDQDLVARLGGDEFAVVLRDVDVAAARTAVARMISLLQRPVTLGGLNRIVPKASAGLAMLHGGIDATEGMMRADVAMYAAKRGGKNGYVLYDPEVHSSARSAVPQTVTGS